MQKILFTLLTLLLCLCSGAWAETYTDKASTVTWAFTSHSSLGSTNVPNDAFLSTNFSAGSNLSSPTTFSTKDCKAGWAEQTLVYYKPIATVAKNADDAAANMLEWTITPATGITFTPASVSITACTAGGTGDPQVTIYAVYSDDSKETIQERTNPRRPDKTDQGDGPSVYSKTLTSAVAGKFKVRLYFAGLTNTGKGAAVTNIVVTGKVSGTPVATTTYTITAATNDATLGGASGTATVAENEKVTLKAIPTAAGYFVKWQKDDADFDGNTVNPLTVTATAGATYTAIFEALKSITYNIASENKGTAGVGYATQYANTSNKWTAPLNYYYASEGKTLTNWNDGENDYTPGTEYTLTGNIAVTPVFTTNAVTLSDITEETTVSWPFGTNDGAPTLSSEGNTQYYVQQATIAGQKIDVPIFVNTVNGYGISGKKGKFVGSATNAQVNAGTVFKIPAVKGMVVSYESANTFELSDIGFTDDTSDLGGDGSALSDASSRSNNNKTITYTYTGSADFLYLVDKVGSKYPTGLSVTYPYVPKTAPDAPTFPATTTVDGGSTVAITSNAVSVYYQWNDNADAGLTTESAGWTAGTSVTVPNEAGTKYLYAYASNSETLNSAVVSKAFTITKTATIYAAKTWDFTNWSDATITGVKGDGTNWNQYERTNSGGTDFGENGRSLAISRGNNSLSYNNTKIAEADGLKFTCDAYGLGLMFNLPSTSIGTYHGSQYIWLYSASSTIKIEGLSKGTTIEIGVESHKDSDARGITLSNATQTQGETTSTAYQVCKYTVDKDGDVTITPSKGLHIYYISVSSYPTKAVAITPAYDKSTYVTTKALDFSNVNGLKAYVATAAAGGKVTLGEVGAVPAGTPLMLIGTADTEYTVPVAASATAPATNLLRAGDGTTTFGGTSFDYILYSDGKFYQIGEGTVATTKAYLHCETDPTAAAGVRGLSIVFAGETTGIGASLMNNEEILKSGEVYDLQGRKVANPTKGLYIVDGKKVIIN